MGMISKQSDVMIRYHVSDVIRQTHTILQSAVQYCTFSMLLHLQYCGLPIMKWVCSVYCVRTYGLMYSW